MARRPALSKSEMEAARIVWNLGQATVRQVFEAFPRGAENRFLHRANLPPPLAGQGISPRQAPRQGHGVSAPGAARRGDSRNGR